MAWFHRLWLPVVVLLLSHYCARSEKLLQDTNVVDVVIEDEEERGTRTFEPTHEWKVVEDGLPVPSGLHIRMNLETGLKEAKLLDESEQGASDTDALPTAGLSSTSRYDKGASQHKGPSEKRTGESGFRFNGDKRRQHHYGESDRRGIINKRTMAFTKEQAFESMTDKSEHNDISRRPELTAVVSTEDQKEFEEPTLGRIPKVTKLEDSLPGVPFAADTIAILQHTRVLTNQDSTVLELEHSLEELEFYVHQIDNARDLNDMGGLVPILRHLNHSHPDIRSLAAQVIGSAAQSNPKVQGQTVLYGGLRLLCRLIKSPEPQLVQRRALFAIGALLRGNPSLQYEFLEDPECQGLKELGDNFPERAPHVQLKSVALLTDLINEQELQLASILHHHIQSYGWCHHSTTMLYDPSLPKVEKAVLAMEALNAICDFTSHAAKIQELTQMLEENVKIESDDEFKQGLLHLCLSQLQMIRASNREL